MRSKSSGPSTSTSGWSSQPRLQHIYGSVPKTPTETGVHYREWWTRDIYGHHLLYIAHHNQQWNIHLPHGWFCPRKQRFQCFNLVSWLKGISYTQCASVYDWHTHLHKQQMNRDRLRDTLSYCVCSLSAKWIWKKIVKKKKVELLWSPEREEMWLAQLEWTERQTDGQISWRLTWRGNTGHFSVQSWEGRTGPETHCWKTVREMGSDRNTCSPVSHQPLSIRNNNSSKLQVGETAAHLISGHPDSRLTQDILLLSGSSYSNTSHQAKR